MSIVLQGSTSGSITLQEPAIAGSTVLSLPATSGTLITTGSSGQSIPKAALPTGSVLQVVNASINTTVGTSSTSYVDTGLTASITPTSSSSRVLVLVSLNNISNSAADVTAFNILRGSTTLISNNSGGMAQSYSAWATGGGGGMVADSRKISSSSLQFLDSPATTSSTTYKVQMRVNANTGYLNSWALNSDVAGVSFITLMEIAA